MAIYIYNEIEPPFEREHEYTYTGSDQVLTIPRNGKYFLETKGAGSNSGAGGLATAYFNLREGDKLAVMVGQKGGTNSTTYGFGGESNYSSSGGGAGLTGFFTGESTITATDSARALIIGGGAGGTIKAGDGGAGGGTTGANGYSASGYGTAGGGGTQTGRGTGGNAGASQFNGGNGSGTYGAGGGGGRRGGNGSAGDSSSADDKGAGGGSGYISSEGMDGTNTQGGGSAKSTDGRAKITFIEDWTPPVPTPTWHIPSQQEFSNLISAMSSLSLNKGSDYNEKLHIPFGGYRSALSGASKTDVNSRGYLWTSTPYANTNAIYIELVSNSTVSGPQNQNKPSAYNVRLFYDEYIEPDNTRTVEAGTLGGAGIFHNSDLGVISITNGTNKSITIRDKNVGAESVYNSGDTLSESNCGKYFQRGNYYGFPFTGTLTTSSTTVDTTGYGPSHTYSSGTFIITNSSPADRSNPSNNNLWDDSKEEYFVIPHAPFVPPLGESYIPSQGDFDKLKSIIEGLSLTRDSYKQKLHMPFAGSRVFSDASRADKGEEGRYWTSTMLIAQPYHSAYYFRLSYGDYNASYKSNGFSVRCFLNSYVEPDNTRTVEAGTLGSAGIFHNADLGLISVTNGSDKSITMYDKNVGAAEVYNDGDTLTESNCGKLFQRGNYYGFPFAGTVTTSSTTVDTTGYGGSNPYSSSTFIVRPNSPYNWSNTGDNLWSDSDGGYFVVE